MPVAADNVLGSHLALSLHLGYSGHYFFRPFNFTYTVVLYFISLDPRPIFNRRGFEASISWIKNVVQHTF